MEKFIKSALRYEQKINNNPNLVYGKILGRISDNSKVLEFGSGAGVMTEKMAREKKCGVSIIEIDKECYEHAMQYASDGFCGDIEEYGWKKQFARKRFDYILFVDVLEHMREPWKVLSEAAKFLKEDGSILISVPNVSHNSVIIELLNNRFIYGNTGILDYTHLHHFTFTEIQKLVDECRLKPVYLDATYIAVGKNEFDVSYGDVDPYIEEILRKRPFGEVYQHILEVKKESFVEKNQIAVDNRLGAPLSFVLREGDNSENFSTAFKDETDEILSRNPNFFFQSNEEIARLRLELNDLYNLTGEEAAYKEAMDRIASLQHDLDRRNSMLSKASEEERLKDERIRILQEEQEERNSHIKVLDKEIEGYIEEIKDLRDETEELKNNRESLTQELKNKNGHIELLLQTERNHMNLLDSDKVEIERLTEAEREIRSRLDLTKEEVAKLKETENTQRVLLEQNGAEIEKLKENERNNLIILGKKIEEIKNLRDIESKQETLIEQKDEEIERLKERENDNLRIIDRKDEEIEKLSENDSRKEKIIELKNVEIESLKKIENDNRLLIKEKDSEIEKLTESENNYRNLFENSEEEIENLKENEKNLNARIESENEENERLRESEKNLREELANKESEYLNALASFREKEAEYKQTILNKEGHIELLLEVEREYEREKKSRTYRVALIFRKISSFFFPEKSKRRFIAAVFVKGLKNPKLFFKMVNARRIKNFFELAKTEGMDSVREHYRLVEEVEKSRMNPFDSDKYTVTEVGNGSAEGKTVEDYEKLEFNEFKKPTVSIIIPVYNQFEYTYQCLKSIKEQSGDVSYEIIIADDCSTDITSQIKKIVSGIKVIRNKENLRFLKNCNNAAKHAKGEFILFLNNDTQVQENWLDPLIRIMRDDEKAGMVGSKLIYPDGWLQEAGGIVWNDASAWNYGNRKNPDDPEFNYVRETDYISGAAIMIRTSLWKEIGGFDERFAPAYYEDTDLAFEVRKHGFKVIYQPLSVVVHFEGVSNGTDVNEGQKAYQVENCKKFFEKWKDVLEKEHFPNAENVFLAKDRSRFKKQMLVVDHYVPHYDQDAGGKCTYMYLLLMVKMGFKVTFIGDNFFKHEPYTTDLNQKGIEVLYGNYYYNNWEEWLKNNLHYFDYVYLQRPHISIKYIDLVKQYGRAKVFYFAHDLHHVREMREYELTHNPEKLESANKWKDIEYDLFSKADVGHVVGSYEQGVMQKVFPDKPIRNIPLYIYEDIPTDINKDFDKRKDILFVGGFGHPPNADAVLWFAENVFPKILAKIPDIKWHVVGGKVPDKVQALNSEHILIEGFLSDEELHKLYRSCKLAVVPLRYGAGVKGKVVEAAYFQIPMVTTPIGAEGIDSGVGSMLVYEDPDIMAEEICNLYTDSAKLREMSDCGKKLIEKYYTLEEAERVLRQDL